MVTTEKKNLLEQLTDAYTREGHDKDPVRRQAMELLRAKGLPAAKTEEYRFTPIVRSLEANFAFHPPEVSVPTVDLLQVPNLKCSVIAFINGIYSATHSNILDPSIKVSISSPNGGTKDSDPFDLLNQVFAAGEVVIDIPEHHTVAEPLAVVYYFDQKGYAFGNPRWSCRLGAGSKATLVEYTVAPAGNAFFNNKHSIIEAGSQSSLEYVMIQQGGREEILLNNAWLKLADSAEALCYTCTLDGQLVRNNLTLVLDGEKIDAHLHGLYLASGSSLIDNHTVVDHRKPNSFSNELYKGVLDGNGKAVFNGKIFVRPDAQKTNAFQTNRNILLSESSTIHTKPQLEIWADDVKCSHGCTTGQLDEEALFYLRSRGIPKDAARGMLLNAFAGETLEGIHHETIRGYVEQLVMKKLHSNPEA